MSHTVVVAAPPGLSSPAVYLFDAAGDTVLNTGGDTLAPGTNATGKYSATVAETLNGWHYYEVRVSSTVIRNGFAKLTDGGTIYLGEITSTEVAAVQSGLSTVTTAQVNAEVVDALATDTYAEPGQGAPPATTTLAVKLGYIYKAWRNKKTQTSSQFSLYADDTTTIDQKSAVTSDGTTTTLGEVATGP